MRPRLPSAQPLYIAVRIGLPIAIAVLVFVCFLPALSSEFVNWDDLHTLVSNPHYRGLSPSHLRWMFTTLHMGHYQPLSWVTHALVYLVWGLNPFGHHLVNLLLHAANAVLFYFLIIALLKVAMPAAARSDDPTTHVAAAVGALFFAIHPLRVEAVAWATERREVLFTGFLLLTLLAYLRMQEERRAAGTHRRTWFLVSLGCYALSLLSKATGLTLPALLLVLDWYPLGRLPPPDSTLRRAAPAVLVEKLPYALLAVAAAATALLGVTRSEAAMPLATHGLTQRATQAAYGLSFYLWKTAVPVHLSALYPLGGPLDPTELRFVVSALAVVAITAAVIAVRRRYPWALAAWAAYVVTVSPVLGFVQSGPQIAADRYTYVSCLPWAVLVAAGTLRVAHAPQPAPYAAAAVIAVALALLGVGTFAQTRVWHDSLTLWNHVLALEPASHIAYTNRGHAREAAGDRDGALADYDTAIRINPLNADALGGRGKVRYLTGDLDGSLADFNAALRLQPRNGIFLSNRGNTRLAMGDAPGALADFTQAISLEPEFAEAYYNRGNLRQAQGDLPGARADYDAAIRLNPLYAEAYINRGNTRQASGDLPGALADFTSAVRIKPDNANAFFNRANARKASGDLDGALADYSETIRLNPQYASAYNNRATTRNVKGDTDGALADLNEAVRLNPGYAKAYANRGIARRARGDLAGALADFTRAAELTPPNDPGGAALERNVTQLRQQLAGPKESR
jgi:tetratricopeptide (TPR) repeat protein